MARGLGIEIDADSVRALAIEGGKKPKILAFAERRIDPSDAVPWTDRARDAVKAAVAEAGGARGRIAASVDSGDAILRELQLPFTNDEQIRKTVRYELEQHIHNHAIEDLVVDYVKTSGTDKSTQILVAAVPKTLLEERLRLLESAGSDPAVVDLDALALFNALVEAGAVADDAPLLAIYGGTRFTKFLLVENRRPRAIRTIRYSAPVQEAAPSIEVTEKAELEATGEAEPYIVVDQAAPEDILAIEAGRFLMASAASAAPSRILILGRIDPETVAGPLQESTGASVEAFDLLARFAPAPASAEGQGRRLPVALGLALKAVGRDATATDFRREEYSYSKKFETVKSSALVCVYLVLMLLALVGLHLHFKSVDLQVQIDNVLSYQAQVVADAVEHNPTKIPKELQDDPSQSLEYLKRKIDELNTKLGAGDHPIERSSLNLVSRIWKTMDQFNRESANRKTGDAPFYFRVDSVNATQDPVRGTAQISLSGAASAIAVAEGFLQKLRGAAPFSTAWEFEVSGYRQEKGEKGTVSYTFTLRKGKT